MYRSAVLLGLAASAIALPAAAETRSFDLPAFDRIEISAGLHLAAVADGAQSVNVESEDGDFSDLEIEVNDGVLTLSREWNRLRWHQKKASYKITVSAPKIRALDASSGSISTLTKIDSRQFTLDLSSGSFAEVSGRSDTCAVDLSSGANLNARGFICGSASVDVSSGGHGEIAVLNSVAGDASSGGHMAVYGTPERVSIDRSSGGRIVVKPPITANRD
ncbi:GIN domain-containing protein [Hyphococcus sp.]|uniref:GIN domain-containing protein n=1 Tax=Hyphococcus sp. TaxID=2038636 RepID=UPI002088B434|nr:MAG: hypothetical protein DHS20C04_12260 [Marinicaulis sp.]